MAYNRTKWQDHVVERPNTYTEVENDDGSITHEASPGEIIQQGTHDELVAVDGLYRRFVVERKQAAGWKV